jgi:hypothetical protein
VRGWSPGELAEVAQRVAVIPSEFAGTGSLQPMAGDVEVVGDAVCFTPRFPFSSGTTYAVLVGGVAAGTILRPAPLGAPSARVVAIRPAVATVPLNLLRIYVHFSAPMSEGWAARSVRARRADTDEILEGTFLHMEPELWDARRRRLTVFLDPGRIKRGLVPNEEAGYPLVDGIPIVVSVAAEFRDARGRPLRADAQRRYMVGPAVRTRMEPAAWSWRLPAAGSVEPLRLAFDRPLDSALLRRCIWITDATGARLDGRVSVGRNDRFWRFVPSSPWDTTPMSLVVDTRLEDLAGNSVARVFDRDLTRSEDDPIDGERRSLEFRCLSRDARRP